MHILGIETSCDETAASIVDDGLVVRSNVISSQIELHRAHGGVVPELAARGQVQAIIPVVQAAIAESGISRSEIDGVAFTHGPGLAGSLLVGVNAAKALGYALKLPLIPINHLEAHVYANWLLPTTGAFVDEPPLPAVCLLVSGGHTEIRLISDASTYEILGRTRDDAAGEAFDKGARMLGLGYPGGPAIQQASEGGDPTAFALPRARLNNDRDHGQSLDFSFSGLKTALLRLVEPYRLPDDGSAPPDPMALFPKHRPPHFRDDMPLADLAASYEAAIIDVLVEKTARAAVASNARTVMLAGGVAANRRLRERLQSAVMRAWAASGRTDPAPETRWPDLTFCTDNAAMVAGLGYRRLIEGATAGLDVDAYPRFPVAQI
ncbi:MAG: tRNA (adenosine(37)-N6)-threonylcarbamoyltransferase complex transferase subunit TsaD [Thermomicrobiales bacterium]